MRGGNAMNPEIGRRILVDVGLIPVQYMRAIENKTKDPNKYQTEVKTNRSQGQGN